MKISVKRGGGRRRQQVDVLPTLEFGWDKNGVDIAVSFLVWYAYAEVWVR